jgi:predicted permease
MSRDWYALVRARLPQLPADVAEEVAQHLADLYAEALRGGAKPAEAAAAAEAALRDEAALVEDPRSTPRSAASGWQAGQSHTNADQRGGAMFVNLRRDVMYALRMMRRQPGFAAVTILTLALGIGVNVAVFAVMRAALLASIPVPRPEQLVSIVTWTASNGDHTDFSYPLYVDARDAAAPLAKVAAYSAWTVGVATPDQRERVTAEFTTSNYFQVLGVQMRVGPGFSGADERRGAAAVAIVSDGLWRSMFRSDPDVVGRSILVDGQAVTITGVAPPRFTGFVRGQRADIWIPVSQYAPLLHDRDLLDRRTTSWLFLVARLDAGRGREQLERALTNALRESAGAEAGGDWAVHANPASQGDSSLVADLDKPLQLLMMVVGLILVITAANVANLLLARSCSRQSEIAIRQSLGASRGRIAQQLIVEAAVLAAAGGVSALVAGTWVARLFELRTIGGGALTLSVRPDTMVVAFTAAVVIGAALLNGLIPAMGVRRLAPSEVIKHGRDGSRVAAGRGRLRATLTIVQIALSLVLIIGSGLFLRSLARIRAVDPSIVSNSRIAATLNTTLRGYDEARGRQFYDRVLDAVSRQPGIQSAALAYVLPATPGGMRNNLPPRSTTPSIDEPLEYDMVPVSPRFFQTTDLPLLAGRDFEPSDSSTSPPVIIINERMRARFWPSGDAIGQTFRAWTDSYTVVGIARDTKYRSLREKPRMVMYLPLTQLHRDTVNVIVKTSLPADATTAALREAVRGVDPAMPLYNVRTFAEHVDRALYFDRLRARLISWLAALALALAAIGIYGVVSYDVTQRTREVGIRLALGAQRREILAMLLGTGARLALLGVVIGTILALWLTRGVASQLYGITPHDPLTLAGGAAILFAVALAATYIPARRATRIDPMSAVRSE